MVRAQKDMGGLGPISILRETFHLAWTHAKLFLLIQLHLVLPGTIFMQAFLFTYQNVFQSSSYFFPSPGSLQTASEGDSSPFNTIEGTLLKFVIYVGSVLISRSLQASWTTGIGYTVGLIYSGKTSISLIDVVHAIPRFKKRVFITYLWASLLGYFVMNSPLLPEIMIGIPLDAVNSLATVQQWLGIFPSSLKFSGAIGMAVVAIVLRVFVQMAAMASVLDMEESDNHGDAAFIKGSKAFKGKGCVSMAVMFLSCLPMLIPVYFHFFFQTTIPELFGSLEAGVLCVMLSEIVLLNFTMQFQCLVAAVLYVSVKAFHGETVTLLDDLSRPISEGTHGPVEENSKPFLASEEG